MIFIDESGIIPKACPNQDNDREHYFVIAFIQTENPHQLKVTYKRILQKLRKHMPLFFDQFDNHYEIKGSALPPYMKHYIIEQLMKKTDIQIAHMVVDNRKILNRFRKDTTRSFNYLIKLVLENMPLPVSDRDCLKLVIDNRNTAVQSLKELEGYLYNELVLEKPIVSDVFVQYMDSKNSVGIQVADIFANLFYQRYRYHHRYFPRYTEEWRIKQKMNVHPATAEYMYQYVKSSGRLVRPFVHPYAEVIKSGQFQM